MQAARKQFSRSLFDEHDALCKMAGMIFLFDRGAISVSGNRNQYGVDLLYTHPYFGDELRLLECEVKNTWPGGAFPFDTINVLQRKAKYFNEGADLFLLAGNHQDFLCINSQDVLDSPLVAVRNKYVYEGELFYQVPLDKAHFGKFRERIVVPDNLHCLCCEGLAFSRKGKKFICIDCETPL